MNTQQGRNTAHLKVPTDRPQLEDIAPRYRWQTLPQGLRAAPPSSGTARTLPMASAALCEALLDIPHGLGIVIEVWEDSRAALVGWAQSLKTLSGDFESHWMEIEITRSRIFSRESLSMHAPRSHTD